MLSTKGVTTAAMLTTKGVTELSPRAADSMAALRLGSQVVITCHPAPHDV